MEWIIVFLISIAAGVGTVEYQKARQDPQPFTSPAVPTENAPVFNGVKINGKDARV